MPEIATHRCLAHPSREAVARCPECGQFFCRECITEHEDRVICAACLRKIARQGEARRPRLLGWARVGLSVAGFCVAALYFYWMGQVLLTLPTSFHDGTVWRASVWSE